MCLVWIPNIYIHLIKWLHHFCLVWIYICNKCTVTPRGQTKSHRMHYDNMWTLLDYSIPLLHIFSLYAIYNVSFNRNTHALYARYVHRSSPVKASQRWIGESLLVLTRLECKKHMKLHSLLGCEMTVLVRDLRFSQKYWWRFNLLEWDAASLGK